MEIPGALAMSRYLEYPIASGHPYSRKINSNWNKCKQIQVG